MTEFGEGDEFYYTPRIFGEPGSYAEQHVVDVDLVGRKPVNLSYLEAASLTLVGGNSLGGSGDASPACRRRNHPDP